MWIPYRTLCAAVLACCFYTASTAAHAVTFSVWDVIYQQDFNGDGRLDYIITPPVQWALVPVGKINTMVPIAQPYSVLLQQADGSYVVQQQNNFTILDPRIQGLTGLSRTFLDFNGDGNLDFLLRTGDAKGVVVFGNDKAASTSASVDLSAYTRGGNLVMTVSDVNGDGIRDIVLKEDDVITAIAYGNSNNTYSQLSYQFPADNPANLVVNLAGTLDVNDLGAASYNLPIDLPPGMNGLQPSVSIDYSSMSGNGPMGIGWNLSASSAVNRCGSTLARDGLHDGVDFDNTDKFCLDGQRLLSIRQNTYAQADQTMDYKER